MGHLELAARPGGYFQERWTDERGQSRLTSGHVTTMVEPTTLCLRWVDHDWPAETAVHIEIHDAGSGTTTVRPTQWLGTTTGR